MGENSEKTTHSDNFLDPLILAQCDLGVVLTESGNHFIHAKRLLMSGLDVLIEKPITLRMDHAKELACLAKSLSKKIYVVKQNRFNNPILQARKAFEDGRLGNLQIGTVRVRWCRPQSYYDQADWRGTWEMDGGVIANQASHHIDLLQWFMGPVESVSAFSARFGVDIDTEDTVVATLKFASGALGTIEATTSVRPRNLEGSLSLLGSKGSIEIGGFAVNELSKFELSSGENLEFLNEPPKNDTSDVYGSGHIAVYREILKDRQGIPNDSVAAEESLKSLELIHMIYKSIEENRTVSSNETDTSSCLLGK